MVGRRRAAGHLRAEPKPNATFAGALVVAALVTVPEVVGAPVSFLHDQIHLAGGELGCIG
jgi:hypothetical protein